MTPDEENRVHRVYLLSLALKAAAAVFEISAAIVLVFLDAEAMQHAAMQIIADELLHHPNDWLAALAANWAVNFSIEAKTFAALYLASHGVVKLMLVVALWRNLAWAYPVSIVAFSAFIVYQLYRFTFTHSVFLIVLTVFDLVVIVLVWHEWRYRRAGGAVASRPVH